LRSHCVDRMCFKTTPGAVISPVLDFCK
jgi:hypothetical protein